MKQDDMTRHRHWLRWTIGMSIVIMSLMVASVWAQDDTDQIGVKAVLTDATPSEGTLELTNSMHLYALHGETLRLDMTQQDGDLDPFLILLDSDGRLLAWNDDRQTGSLDAGLSASLGEQPLGFVLASSLDALYKPAVDDDDALGSYVLSAEGTTAQPLDLTPSAFLTETLRLDEPLIGAISDEQPIFWTVFSVRDSITVDLRVNSLEIDPLLYVFDTQGQRIAVDDDSGEDGTSAYVRDLPLNEAGQYVVIVTTFDFHKVNERGIEGGNFTLMISRSETNDS